MEATVRGLGCFDWCDFIIKAQNKPDEYLSSKSLESKFQIFDVVPILFETKVYRYGGGQNDKLMIQI